MTAPVDPSPDAITYHQVSILRPPRTVWERICGWFGARYFEVETRTAAGAVPPRVSDDPAVSGAIPHAQWHPGLAE